MSAGDDAAHTALMAHVQAASWPHVAAQLSRHEQATVRTFVARSLAAHSAVCADVHGAYAAACRALTGPKLRQSGASAVRRDACRDADRQQPEHGWV